MSGSIAVGGRVDIGYKAESTFGTTIPSTVVQSIRDVSFSLNLQKEAYQSEQRRSDRMRDDVRHGYRSVTGDISGELSVQSWDDFIEAAMGGTWDTHTPVTIGVTSVITSQISNNRFFRGIASESFLNTNLSVGDVFSVSVGSSIPGITDRLFTATSVAAASIEVEPGQITVTTSLSTAVFTRVGRRLTMGNTYRSFSIERYMTDKGLYQQFSGVRVNQMTISAPATGLVTVTFGFSGRDGSVFSSTTVASSYTDQVQTVPFAAVNGDLHIDGQAMGFVTAAEITLNNNMSGPQVFGANVVPDMIFGRFADVTGTITVLFTSADMHAKFVNETESTLILRLQDADGLTSSTGFIQITLPRIKYTGADVDDSADTGVTVQMPFTALKPLSTSVGFPTSAMVIQRSNS